MHLHPILRRPHYALGLLTGLLLWAAPTQAAPPVTLTPAHCGQVLTGPTVYQLTADLHCDAFPTVLDSATLLLNGHGLSCRAFSVTCLVLRGSRAQVWRGRLGGAYHENIVLEGDGRHTIRDVAFGFSDNNVLVFSDDNRLTNLSASSGVHPAFHIRGNGNRLTHIQAFCGLIASGGCVSVIGNDNRLDDLDVTVQEDMTFAQFGSVFLTVGAVHIRGNSNEVSLSTIRNTDGIALIVEGVGNRLRANRLQGVGDAVDLSGTCTANSWRRNLLLTHTAEPACLLPTPGPVAARDTDD